MTVYYRDLSEYNSGSGIDPNGVLVVLRSSIGSEDDAKYDDYVAAAKRYGVPYAAYHFLNSGSLGVSAAAQADFAYSVVGKTPLMLDLEPNKGNCASLAEAYAFIDRFRARGGICNLVYLPYWVWSNPAGNNGLGSPNLGGLISRGMKLVSSNYTTYSDTGPGWQSYGGMAPAIWQYMSSPYDTNAFRGTASQLLELFGLEDYDMAYSPETATAIAIGAIPQGFVTQNPPTWDDSLGTYNLKAICDKLDAMDAEIKELKAAATPPPVQVSAAEVAKEIISQLRSA